MLIGDQDSGIVSSQRRLALAKKNLNCPTRTILQVCLDKLTPKSALSVLTQSGRRAHFSMLLLFHFKDSSWEVSSYSRPASEQLQYCLYLNSWPKKADWFTFTSVQDKVTLKSAPSPRQSAPKVPFYNPPSGKWKSFEM